MNKIWCNHIRWDLMPGDDRYTLTSDKKMWIIRMPYSVKVPRSWKVCPICTIERPTRTHIAALINMALQDGDQ